MVEINKEIFNGLVQNPNKITLDQSIALKKIIKIPSEKDQLIK